jgi:phosphoribosylamine--glycine ligase/phosphoribosylformylglycinamidine cyclo-ligase
MLEGEFGSAGEQVVIEEFLEGDQISILTFSDGITFKSLPPAQDHKKIFHGDRGPNMGGMGCYAPVRLDRTILHGIEETILRPTFEGLKKEGKDYPKFQSLRMYERETWIAYPFPLCSSSSIAQTI